MNEKAKATIEKDGFEICEGFRIRKIKTAAGKVRFQLDLGTKSGRHVRRTYKTKKEARGEARAQAVNFARKDFDAVKFSDDQRADAVEALAILEAFDCNLRDAAHFYEKHHRPVDASNDFALLVEAYLSGMESRLAKGAIRKESVLSTKNRLRPFKEEWAGRNIESIETRDVEALLDAREWIGTNRKNYLRNLSVFFNAMLKQSKVAVNPCAMVETVSGNIETPAIYTPAKVSKIMHQAEGQNPELVPYLALCFFAGMRPQEAQRIDWEEIDFELSEIHIKADVSKTRTARIIQIPENLKVWLVKYRKASLEREGFEICNGLRIRKDLSPKDGIQFLLDLGTKDKPHARKSYKTIGEAREAANAQEAKVSTGNKVYPYSDSSLKRARKEVYKAVSIAPIQDGARHSFATYFYALNGLDSTLDQLGHRSPAMLHRHYKGLAKNRVKQAQKYFDIMPKNTPRVLQMPIAKKSA
jgi:integrase